MDRSQEVVAMFTYRRELEREGWHRPWPLRLVLVVLGLFVGVLGLFGWSMEQEKGGWEGSGLGHHMVEEDELTDRVFVWSEDGELVFEGTSIEEVDAWIESRRNRDFTAPILLLVGAGVLFIAGAGPSPRRPEPSDAPPRVDVRS